MFECPCCKNETLTERSEYEICSVCNWEDDGQGDHNADKNFEGPNFVSLAQARDNYKNHGTKRNM